MDVLFWSTSTDIHEDVLFVSLDFRGIVFYILWLKTRFSCLQLHGRSWPRILLSVPLNLHIWIIWVYRAWFQCILSNPHPEACDCLARPRHSSSWPILIWSPMKSLSCRTGPNSRWNGMQDHHQREGWLFSWNSFSRPRDFGRDSRWDAGSPGPPDPRHHWLRQERATTFRSARKT